MAGEKLSNGEIEIVVRLHGAELASLKECATGREFMWSADPKYWKYSSPVLFPFVGRLANLEYRYGGKIYEMKTPHGFARNNDFVLIEKTSDALWFAFCSNEETKKIYPFDFELRCGYVLHGKSLDICWEVHNTGGSTMYYSLGGHPAFVCPETEDRAACFADLHTAKLSRRFIDEQGLAIDKFGDVALEDGLLPLRNEYFVDDAIVLEHDQTHQVTLLSPEKKPYFDVKFDAPLFGIWAPKGKDAPFVCIEPWYGRCDKAGYCGTLEDREWGNKLDVGAKDNYRYTVTVL